MLADLGLTPESAGKMLHVNPRTVRYWISGKTLIPYSAYRLLRILTGAELPYKLERRLPRPFGLSAPYKCSNKACRISAITPVGKIDGTQAQIISQHGVSTRFQ